MSLPLLEQARDESVAFVRVSTRRRDTDARASIAFRDVGRSAHAAAALMPSRALRPGEQYRFHVDMESCIGCKCCVVACNEQNGNPASINWRRVVEIEGGWYPQTRRSYLSMGCNHCLEPTCLAGSTAPGTARTACRSTTPSVAWSANATCATAVCRSASRRPA
jgi:ferredoxin